MTPAHAQARIRFWLLLAAMIVAGSVVLTRAAATPPRPLPVLHIPAGSIITAEGDSLTYGMDATPQGGRPPINGSTLLRSVEPFPEALDSMLAGAGCSVRNLGFPGDRSVDGLVRWQNEPAPALAVLMYGSNDALNNGGASSGTLSIETFRFVFTELIERRRRGGAQVLILIPPPYGEPRADARIELFRNEVRSIADRLNLPLIDTPELLRDVRPVWTADYVHLSPVSNHKLAETLAKVIHCGS